ncbi:hypothetical protein WN51_04963 [Melipona quadrifasciata]|uniref:Uncharacterized protein n=1 Tax=Melipona quadrifasciata TaxID=166423 RepID=A0A0N0BCY5_9HYME|nr:hypothetical protein WN51_04963 [Melipona quadrifasciata]
MPYFFVYCIRQSQIGSDLGLIRKKVIFRLGLDLDSRELGLIDKKILRTSEPGESEPEDQDYVSAQLNTKGDRAVVTPTIEQHSHELHTAVVRGRENGGVRWSARASYEYTYIEPVVHEAEHPAEAGEDTGTDAGLGYDRRAPSCLLLLAFEALTSEFPSLRFPYYLSNRIVSVESTQEVCNFVLSMRMNISGRFLVLQFITLHETEVYKVTEKIILETESIVRIVNSHKCFRTESVREKTSIITTNSNSGRNQKARYVAKNFFDKNTSNCKNRKSWIRHVDGFGVNFWNQSQALKRSRQTMVAPCKETTNRNYLLESLSKSTLSSTECHSLAIYLSSLFLVILPSECNSIFSSVRDVEDIYVSPTLPSGLTSYILFGAYMTHF